MRSGWAVVAAGAVCVAACALNGCETGRGNKVHASFESVSDVTTIPHPEPQFASVSTGIPPVPASPTGAGADGRQPFNDSQARHSPGAEDGTPMAPREQPKDRFLRQ